MVVVAVKRDHTQIVHGSILPVVSLKISGIDTMFTTKNNVKKLLFLSIIMSIGCSLSREQPIDFTEWEVDDVSLLVGAETESEIATPATIITESNGFLIYDVGTQRFIKFDTEGNKTFSFGREGRGPGEYQQILAWSAFWKFDDVYLLFDRLGAKFITYDEQGKWLEDIPLDNEEFSWFTPRQIIAITPSRFIIPTKGENNSLLKFVDLNKNRVSYFGNPVGGYVMDMTSEERHRAIRSGNIPGDIVNEVIPAVNESGIFSFQQTTAKLEKYSLTGEPVWSQSLKIPAQQGLFDYVFDLNAEQMRQDSQLLPYFNYARSAYANEEGIAILLNNLHESPAVTKVIWVSNDGQDIVVLRFPGLDSSSPHQPGSIAISSDQSHIYFVKMLSGEIYRATWPL